MDVNITEIKNQGDKVIIRQNPDITIRDYQKGQKLVLETPEATNKELLIDKGKYFAFTLDDIDAHQSDLKLMNNWSDDASEQMKIVTDTEFFEDIATDPIAANKGASAGRISGDINLGATGSPIALTKSNILDYIVDLGTVLDESNVPENGRWIALPAWACGMIKKSDLKDASITGDSTSAMRNGRLGIIDRFTLYSSNLLYSTTDGADTAYHIMAGHNDAITWASQMVKMETLRAETTFGDIVRGLNVYGYETLKPEALALLYAKKG